MTIQDRLASTNERLYQMDKKLAVLLARNDCMDYWVIVMGCSSGFLSSDSSSKASSSINFFIRSLSLIS
jgi:hypothetical protein